MCLFMTFAGFVQWYSGDWYMHAYHCNHGLYNIHFGWLIILFYFDKTYTCLRDIYLFVYNKYIFSYIKATSFIFLHWNLHTCTDNIYIVPLLLGIPMAFHHIDKDIRSKRYVPVTLRFRTIAYPEPEYTWEQWTHSSWTQITNNSMFLISSRKLQSNLTVYNFTTTTANEFRLTVKNEVGTLIQHYTLQPFGKVACTLAYNILPFTV